MGTHALQNAWVMAARPHSLFPEEVPHHTAKSESAQYSLKRYPKEMDVKTREELLEKSLYFCQ